MSLCVIEEEGQEISQEHVKPTGGDLSSYWPTPEILTTTLRHSQAELVLSQLDLTHWSDSGYFPNENNSLQLPESYFSQLARQHCQQITNELSDSHQTHLRGK